ncbi:hypothetical protein [Streptomyces sp. NPDC057695]
MHDTPDRAGTEFAFAAPGPPYVLELPAPGRGFGRAGGERY